MKFKPFILLAGIIGVGTVSSTLVAPIAVAAAPHGQDEMVKFVIGVVAKHFGRQAHTIDSSNTLVEYFGADSLDFIELTETFEEQLGVYLKPDTVDLKSSAWTIAQYLVSRTQ